MLTKNEESEALSLLYDILSIRTVNGEDDTAPLAQYLSLYLQNAGIRSSVEYIDEKNSNVTAWVQGETDDIIVLCGHMDTVPFGSLQEWHTPPQVPVLEGGRVYARGASDMKGGLAAMVFALAQLGRRGVKPKSSLLFIGTADEEKGGRGAAAAVKNGLPKETKLLLIAEPTACDMGLAQKGCIWLKFLLEGKTAHAAYPTEGVSALDWALKLAESVKQFACRYEDALLGASTVTITSLHAGIANNMLPDRCEMVLDIRTVPGLAHKLLLTNLHQIIEGMEAEQPKLAIHMEIINDRMPVSVPSENAILQEFLKLVYAATGKGPAPVGINFFTDASILVRECPHIPVVLYGPGEQQTTHKPNEYMMLQSYFEAVGTYCRICSEL